MRATQVFLLCLLLSVNLAIGQEKDVINTQQEIEQTRQYVDELTRIHGRLDYRLLEPLHSLANSLVETGRFDEAHASLDHAAQIARVTDGLYTQSQYPFLLSKVENFANRGDWLHARSLMDHLDWLLTRKENKVDNELIVSFMRLTDLHLRGVAEDHLDNQGYHFRSALEPNELAIAAGSSLWGSADSRLPPIIYKLVLQYYFQHQAIEAGGRTSSSLRSYSNSGLTRSRADARERYYYAGVRRLIEIRDIYLRQDQPNIQAIGLADMYLADWEVLFANSEGARRAYLRSFNELAQAGIKREAINAFFHHPALLPAPQLHTSWNEIVLARPELADIAVDSSQPQATALSFKQWSSNIPFVSVPIGLYDDPSFEEARSESIVYSFTLTGLDRSKRWNLGRYRATTSAAQDLKIVTQTFSKPLDQDQIQQRVRALRFRPKLINGVPQSVNATLHYQLATSD